jgi:hypothetical protein
MMERDKIVRWAVKELGQASKANVEAVLDEIMQEREKRKNSKPLTKEQRISFQAALKRLLTELNGLPPNLRSQLSRYQLDPEHCAAWKEICEEYPRAGKPKPDAWLQRFVSACAHRLLIQLGKQIDLEGMNRSAAILYGDRKADLRPYCRKTLAVTPVDWIYSWSTPVRLKIGLGPQHQQASTLGATPVKKPRQK